MILCTAYGVLHWVYTRTFEQIRRIISLFFLLLGPCFSKFLHASQKKVLVTLLVVNGVMFLAEIIIGLIAQSTGVIADSLDMLADAMVYSIGLYAC